MTYAEVVEHALLREVEEVHHVVTRTANTHQVLTEDVINACNARKRERERERERERDRERERKREKELI